MSKLTEIPMKPADAEFRHEYMADQVKVNLALSIRNMREARGWTQDDLAFRLGVSQGEVSRYEDPDYTRWNFSTLLRIAQAFEVAFVAQFCSWEEWQKHYGPLPEECVA